MKEAERRTWEFGTKKLEQQLDSVSKTIDMDKRRLQQEWKKTRHQSTQIHRWHGRVDSQSGRRTSHLNSWWSQEPGNQQRTRSWWSFTMLHQSTT